MRRRRVGQQDLYECSTDRTPCFRIMTMRCYVAAGPDERYTVVHAARDAAFSFSYTGESKGQQALSVDFTGCILTKPCQSASGASCISKLAGVTGIFILARDDYHPSLLVVRFPVSHPLCLR
jgi:hypothetical protein